MTTFGYCLPWCESAASQRALADCDSGLLAPFMDGLVEASHRRTRPVYRRERCNGYKDPARFAATLVEQWSGFGSAFDRTWLPAVGSEWE